MRQLRLRAELDQQTLAKLAHISVGTIRNYERGTTGKAHKPIEFKTDMLRAIACGLATNPETLEVNRDLETSYFFDLLRAAGYLPEPKAPSELVQHFVEGIMPNERARIAAMRLDRSGFLRTVDGRDRLADLLEEAHSDYQRKLREDDS